jgi:hypothetical protein
MHTLRAIVVPPAQGKSYMMKRGLPPHIREADSIVHCKATPELACLRQEARLTGDWASYDQCLSSLLVQGCRSGDIVMVAAAPLAKAMGAEVVGVYVSTPSLWESNIKARGQHPSKHLACYLEACALTPHRYTSLDAMYIDICSLQ